MEYIEAQMEEFISRFGYDLGVDLGTANTLVYVVGKGVAVREPSVVARHRKTKQVLAIGSEARKMLGKTPQMIEAVRPVAAGVIADIDATESMLAAYIKRAIGKGGILSQLVRPRVVVGIPSGVTEVERRAVLDVVMRSGARRVYLVENPMVGAIGSGVPVLDSNGTFVVDIGAGRTEMAVISLGGIVLYRSIKVAGEEMDRAIVNYLRLKHSLLIGDQSAEEVKITLGNMWASRQKYQGKEGEDSRGKEKYAVVRGRDLESGLPVSMRISESEVREAVAPVVREIISTIQDLIEETPPELVSDIFSKGIVMVGGGSLLGGLDKLVAEEVRLPVWVADEAMGCVARGCGKTLEDGRLLDKVRVIGGVR